MNELSAYVNSIVILSENILPEYIAEIWLDRKFKVERRKTSKAVERYIVIELVRRIKNEGNGIDKNEVIKFIDERIKFLTISQVNYKGNKSIGIGKLREVKQDKFNILLVDRMIREIYNIENLFYMKTILCSNIPMEEINYNEISNSGKSILQDLEVLKLLVMDLSIEDMRFKTIQEGIETLLYKNKEYYPADPFQYNYKSNLNNEQLSDYCSKIAIEDIYKIFVSLETIIETQSDPIIEYIISELTNMKKYMENKIKENKFLKESFDPFKDMDYINMVKTFESMTLEDISDDNDELDVVKIAEYYELAREIATYEILNEEAGTKIITKGTEKVTKKIGDASSKDHGMADVKSKVGAIKRGARIIDDRASDAVNRKIDNIMNLGQEAKREKIITGKNTFKLSSALKTAIGLIGGGAAAKGVGNAVGAKAAKKIAGKSIASKVVAKGAKVALGPIVGAAIAIIGALTVRALHKNTEEREKKRILLELETELKITKEKIEDAKAENDKEAKYQLMRIQTNLEKEITRIKHGLRYY